MEQRLRLIQGSAGRTDKRSSERRKVQVPGQIVWKDHRGQTQMASVVTRDVSEHGVSIECRTGLSIPMYRLVYFQIDRLSRHHADLVPSLRKQNVLSAVFRVGPSNETTGTPTEYGLRLMVEPRAAATPEWKNTPSQTRTA
jgi:PilZ domain